MSYILGRKLGMTSIKTDDGSIVPVTLIEATPNIVAQIKTVDKDGYNAVAVSYTPKHTRSPKTREFKVESVENLKLGQEITVDSFKDVKQVSIQSISKGKGFQGGIKLHNFKVHGDTHGEKQHRSIGSSGCRSYPGRVIPGKAMPAHMGVNQLTIKRIPLIDIESSKHLLALKGPVPGARNSLVKVWS